MRLIIGGGTLAGKPQLLFIHGIGSARTSDVELREWSTSLANGARAAGHADLVSGLTQSWAAETRFANYSDLFYRADAQGAADGISEEELPLLLALLEEMTQELGHQAELAGDRRSGDIIDSARAQIRAAVEPDAVQGQGLFAVVRRAGNAVTTLLQLPGLRQASQWTSGVQLLPVLSQVGRYLARKEPDDAGQGLDVRIRERVLSGLDPSRPLIVISHSLGTVVAYEALHMYTGRVPLWITLGSPLAMGALVLQRLAPRPPQTPAGVERWLNFWDRDDIVVARPRLERWMEANALGVVPVTARADTHGLWTHTATKYLAHKDVAGPVAETLKNL
ncbi:hypothetical protein [Streptomyces sp. NBC_00059]|uniref:hypothetical protein n=1 Tax=Streptomyces sp. NBC_00059 TaxID=2975635 RepID=UPI00224ED9DB|nr:hypothetical protein [Streptomyces sp. NBC_00059]MCX5417283.1 hypothetical protein [Streptomyces sp. NBC_00059]